MPPDSVLLVVLWRLRYKRSLRVALSLVRIPALLVKNQGYYPPFWHKDASFLGVMEDLYDRVRTKNSQMK